MAYRVDITARAARDLGAIYRAIDARSSSQSRAWFNGLERAVLSLNEYPARSPQTPEDAGLRHLIYGAKRDLYRIIYCVDEHHRVVTVLHIRHGARRPLASKDKSP